MTKSELVSHLAQRYPGLARDMEDSVNEILDAIFRSVGAGGRVEIRGFGSFDVTHRPPRVGRNPKTGESVVVAAKNVPHFKAGKELRDKCL